MSNVRISEEKELLDGERVDEIGFGGMTLIQKPGDFCYGIDAVILAEFAASHHKGDVKIAADLGTGTGIIPLILHYKMCPEKIYGIEVQKESYERACRNAVRNGLNERLSFINDDVANAGKSWGKELKGQVDMIVINPPYFEHGGGLINDNRPKTVARHETSAGLYDFLSCASYLLKPKGELFMIHRPSRLVDICCFGRENKLEPKEMIFISPKKDTAANMLLTYMVKGGGRELKILPNIWVYDEDGNYTPEVLRAYR